MDEYFRTYQYNSYLLTDRAASAVAESEDSIFPLLTFCHWYFHIINSVKQTTTN